MDSKPEFCEPCVMAKSAMVLFPQKSDTRTEKYGERVHWDLWGPASVTNLDGNCYIATCTDDHTHENKFYFQPKKMIHPIPTKRMKLSSKLSPAIR
jgi:hypothetical protein